MTTLPFELIGRCLELVAEDAIDFPRRAYATLLSAALVSRTWREPACEVLWRRVHIDTQEHALALRHSAAKGLYHTAAIHINGDNGPAIKDTLDGLVGVRELKIGPECRALSVDFLALPALANLQTLVVRCNLTDPADGEPLPSPSFHLSHLILANWAPCPIASTALLSTSASTLHTLDLAGLAFARNQRFALRPTSAPSFSLLDLASLSLSPSPSPPPQLLNTSSSTPDDLSTTSALPFPLPNLTTLKFGPHSLTYVLSILPSSTHLLHLVTSIDNTTDLSLVLSSLLHPLQSLSLSWTRDYDEADVWGPQIDWDGFFRIGGARRSSTSNNHHAGSPPKTAGHGCVVLPFCSE
ncbi:hypothetical protein RQP46_002318 [Phenoliferia psychrophenolica]